MLKRSGQGAYSAMAPCPNFLTLNSHSTVSAPYRCFCDRVTDIPGPVRERLTEPQKLSIIHRVDVQSTDKKQRILDATMELIAENGLHATPMSQISKRSGVSTGSIYHYFPSKEAIINHLYLDLKKEVADTAFRGYDINAPYQERFFLMWQNFLNYLISKPMQLSFIEQCAISPLISAEAKEAGKQYRAPLAGFVTEGCESGYLKKLDSRLILSLIHGTIIGTAKLQSSEALDITDEQRVGAAQVCWDGLKAE